jgi:cystathionine gamma-synthase/methionine-gamma-lyase
MSEPSASRNLEPEDPRDVQPLVAPVYQTTTFVFDSAQDVVDYNEGRSRKYLYSRYANPTVTAVERTLAELDGVESALVFGSGMAATLSLLMALTRAGDEVVCGSAVYGGTFHLLHDVLSRFGVAARFVSLDELAAPETVIGGRTRLVWFESPVNPTLRCVDIARIGGACRARGVLSVIDNTFASPVNQRPAAMGIDLVMQSATKYLNGHSDVTAGVVSGSRQAIGPVGDVRRLLGTVADPVLAASLGRGLKTLAVRVERQNATGAAVASFLEGDVRVARVWYPGLPSSPDYEIARRQMRGYGGMICFDVDGTYERAAKVFDRLRLVKRAASLGGVESLVSLPVLTSHWGHTDGQLAACGVTRGMLRLSVGLEDASAIIGDLDQALA